MTVTLELKPETEARLREHAAREGLSLEEYILSLAETDVSRVQTPSAGTKDDPWQDARQRLAQALRDDAEFAQLWSQPLADDAFSDELIERVQDGEFAGDVSPC